MKMMLTLAALAAVAPALHAPRPNQRPRHAASPSSIRTSTSSTARSADKLERRIWRAVVTIIAAARPDYDTEGKIDVRHCRRDTMRRHQPTPTASSPAPQRAANRSGDARQPNQISAK